MLESLHSAQSESGESQNGAGVDRPSLTTKSKAELWREVKILSMFLLSEYFYQLRIPYLFSFHADTHYPILYYFFVSSNTYSA
jgi:hypothetical protein